MNSQVIDVEAQQWASVNVTVSESLPEAMTRTGGVGVKDLRLTLNDILEVFPGTGFENFDMERTINVARPESADALTSMINSTFWKDNIKNTNSPKIFKLRNAASTNNATLSIYSLRRFTGTMSREWVSQNNTYDNVSLVSVMRQNQIAKSLYDQDIIPLTALARVALTDANIRIISEMTNTSMVDTMKKINNSFVRKPQQLRPYTVYIDGNLAAAQQLRSWYTQRSITEAGKSIIIKNISKIQRDLGTLDDDRVRTYLTLMTGTGAIDADRFENIVQLVRNTKQQGYIGAPTILPYSRNAVVPSASVRSIRGENLSSADLLKYKQPNLRDTFAMIDADSGLDSQTKRLLKGVFLYGYDPYANLNSTLGPMIVTNYDELSIAHDFDADSVQKYAAYANKFFLPRQQGQ